MQSCVSEGLRSIRQEFHGWACLLTTLASLERHATAPQLRQDMQLQLLQQFPASAYLSYQTAAMCADTPMPTRLRMSVSMLLRVAGRTAPPNMQLVPVLDACMVEGNTNAGRVLLNRLASHRPPQRKRWATAAPCGPLDALRCACGPTHACLRVQGIGRLDSQGSHFLACCKWTQPCGDCAIYSTSRLVVIQLAYMQLLTSRIPASPADALNLGISARHHSRWCKGLWLLSSTETADAMDEKDIRYIGEQLKWSGIAIFENFDELRLMMSLRKQETALDVKSVTDSK